MKRCPQCNRVEADDTLTFCRADGIPLVRESGAVSEGVGTLRFDSAPAIGETETRIPPGKALNRPTAPTTVLEARPASVNTRELSRLKSRRGVMVAAAVIIAAALAAFAYVYLSRGRSAAPKNSIAVFPFQNASGDPNMEYLSDGISESLVNSLSQLPNVRVLARSTMIRFKGQDADPQQVGKQLSVDTVLTGRVVQIGDSLNVQADLVNVADGSQVRGERYKRKASDILTVQEDITREIVGRLRPRLSGEQQERVTRRGTENAEAYKVYLQGRYFWNRRTVEDFKKAIPYFQKAIELDQGFALAYSGLSDSYNLLSQYGGARPADTMPQAKAAALKALALDESLA